MAILIRVVPPSSSATYSGRRPRTAPIRRPGRSSTSTHTPTPGPKISVLGRRSVASWRRTTPIRPSKTRIITNISQGVENLPGPPTPLLHGAGPTTGHSDAAFDHVVMGHLAKDGSCGVVDGSYFSAVDELLRHPDNQPLGAPAVPPDAAETPGGPRIGSQEGPWSGPPRSRRDGVLGQVPGLQLARR